VSLSLTKKHFNDEVIRPLKNLLVYLDRKNMGPLHGDFPSAIASIDAFVRSPLCIVDQNDQRQMREAMSKLEEGRRSMMMDQEQMRKKMDELTLDARSILLQKEAAVEELLEEREKRKEILEQFAGENDALRSESGILQAEIEDMRSELCTLSNDADLFETRAREAEDIQRWFINSLANQTAEIQGTVVAVGAANREDIKKHVASEVGKVSHTLGEIAASQKEYQKVIADAAEKEKTRAKQDRLLDLEFELKHIELEAEKVKRRLETARIPSGDRRASSHARPPTAPDGAQHTPVTSDVDQPPSATNSTLGDPRSGAEAAQRAPAPSAAAVNGDRASERLCKWEQGVCVNPSRQSTVIEVWQ
jgi:hypothetical protein